VVAVIVIVVCPVATGTEDQVIGSGVGGVVSGAGGSVVADCVVDQLVTFGVEALSRALILKEYWVAGVRPVAV
jgi:hypothetical protein